MAVNRWQVVKLQNEAAMSRRVVYAPTGRSPKTGGGIVRYAVRVVWKSGEEEFLKEGLSSDGPPAIFANRQHADEMRDFMLEGMTEDVQSIDVVLAPLTRNRRQEVIA